MLGLGLSIPQVAVRGASAFTPAALFASGKKGDWWTFDPDGTDAVNDGDAISTATGRANGNDLVQATGAKQPLYKTSGGLHWALFDGTDNLLQTAAFAAEIAQPVTFVIGMEDVGGKTSARVYATGLSETKRQQMSHQSATNFQTYAGSSLSRSTPHAFGPAVITSIFNGASSQIRWDGALSVSGDAGAQPLDGLSLGSYFDGTLSANIKVFSLIVVEGALSGDDLSNAESWTADRCGVTL